MVESAAWLGIFHTINSTNNFGSGVSFFDFDNDGWDDLTFVRENDSLVFYRNTGGGFELIPSLAFHAGQTKQVLWVDIDNDGDNDLLISSYLGTFKLLENDGNFNFTDVTEASGIYAGNADNYGISCVDYDRDGYLDIYLCRYTGWTGPLTPIYENVLYRNNGDGTFTNVAQAAGVSDGAAPSFIGVWTDINDDLWPDLFVINDRFNWGNSLYINNGDGTFTNITQDSGIHAFGDDPMSATVLDFDLDGNLDLITSNSGNVSKEARLFVSNGDQSYTDQALALGFNVNTFSWGITPFDLQNNGFLDLFVCTSFIGSFFPEVPSRLYINNEGAYFTDESSLLTPNLASASYASARGDVNNDGFADLVVQNAKNTLSQLFINDANSDNHYVKISVEGVISNRMGIGTWITVHSPTKTYRRYTQCGEDYCSQSSSRHIFGLAHNTIIDSVTIAFPSGHIDTYYNLEVDQTYHFIEGGSLSVEITTDKNELCEGDQATLTAWSALNVVWSHNESTAHEVTIDQPGTYSFIAYTDLGVPVFSDTLVILNDPVPVIDLEVLQPACLNDPEGFVTINLLSDVPHPDLYVNGLPAGWATLSLPHGSHEIELVTAAGCSYLHTVLIENVPDMEVLLLHDPILCFGEGSDASVMVFGGQAPYTVTWPGDTDGWVYGGSNFIEITDADGCFWSNTFDVNEPDLLLLSIIEEDLLLTASTTGGVEPYTYMWTTPGMNVLSGSQIEIDLLGDYYCTVTDGNNCELDKIFTYTGVGVRTANALECTVFPNPVSTSLQITCNHMLAVGARVFDAGGRIVIEAPLTISRSQLLDLSHLAPGFYTVHLIDREGSIQSTKLLKQP